MKTRDDEYAGFEEAADINERLRGFQMWVMDHEVDHVMSLLSEPFHPSQVKWRVGSTWQRGESTFGRALAYVDSRVVQDQLDRIVGHANWQDSYQETPKRLICTIAIKINGEWVSKSDGAGDTDFEGEKGGLSDAFKRAAVKWGIGRYLYDSEAPAIELVKGGRSWVLPKDFDGSKYLPKYNGSRLIEYMSKVREHFDTISAIKQASIDGNVDRMREEFNELTHEDQQALWLAPTKGGIFTTKERELILKGKQEAA